MKAFEESKWIELGLSNDTIDLLEQAGFQEPTAVQNSAIPLAIKGTDLLVSAKTGSGKTAGFCFPMIEKIRGRQGTLGLILCPTREIAHQTQETLIQFAKPQGITSTSTIGGVRINIEEEELQKYPQIIVGTPGRICDHLERGNIWPEYIEIVVLDEADRMLEMGFANQLNQIMNSLSATRQTLLFSATIAGETEKLARKYLKDPQRISLGGTTLTVANSITHELLWVNQDSKLRELTKVLQEESGPVIIFTRTKIETYNLWQRIHARGFHESGYLSSDKLQKHREQTLKDFQSGKVRILVATDVAGRGIHVDDVAQVVNYDFPLSPEDYIHRVGRTGRKDKEGKAITFVTTRDVGLLEDLEHMLKKRIPERFAPDYQPDKPNPKFKSKFKKKRKFKN